MIVFIYVLKCPITGHVRYVGKTKNPTTRFRKHLTLKRAVPSSLWIQSLLKKGEKPVFEIIDEISGNDWQERERKYILLFKSLGARLLNLLPGGEGGPSMKGRKMMPEQIKRQRESMERNKQNHDYSNVVSFNVEKKGSKIDQFDLDGNFIQSHASIRKAAKAINRDDRRIQFMVKGIKMNGKNINHVGGFVFKYRNSEVAI